MLTGGSFLTEAELCRVGFAQIGRNAKIHSRASIYCPENISLGHNVRIDDFAVIIATGKVKLGTHVHIPNFCYLGGTFGITLEDFCTLAPGVMIFSSSDDYHGSKLTNPTIPQHFIGGKKGLVTLMRHVIVGAGSVILPGCTLGEGASVGALSLVKGDLSSWSIYAGVPAQKLKDRKRDLLELERALRAEGNLS